MSWAKFRHASALALAIAGGVWGCLPVRAQVVVAPPSDPYAGQVPYPGGTPPNGYGQPGPPPPGFFPGQGQQQGAGGFPGQGPQFGPDQRNGQQQLQLPDGMDKLYALQGPNSLLMFGTTDGYALARELVRNIEGDLAVIRVQVALVRVTRTALPGATLAGKTLTPGDLQALLNARQTGQLPASAVARVTTRENTAVDAVIGQSSSVPVTLIPRVETDGRISVQLIQPLNTTVTVGPGQTTALALTPPVSAGPDEPLSVLFLTPAILNSSRRR